MTKLADFEARAIDGMRRRHLARAKNELTDLISSAQAALKRLDAGQVPDVTLVQHAVTWQERIKLVEMLDEVKEVLDSDQDAREPDAG